MQPFFEKGEELVFQGAALRRRRQFLSEPALVEYLQHLVKDLAHFRGIVALVDLVGFREVGEAVEAELGRAAHVHVLWSRASISARTHGLRERSRILSAGPKGVSFTAGRPRGGWPRLKILFSSFSRSQMYSSTKRLLVRRSLNMPERTPSCQ